MLIVIVAAAGGAFAGGLLLPLLVGCLVCCCTYCLGFTSSGISGGSRGSRMMSYEAKLHYGGKHLNKQLLSVAMVVFLYVIVNEMCA